MQVSSKALDYTLHYLHSVRVTIDEGLNTPPPPDRAKAIEGSYLVLHRLYDSFFDSQNPIAAWEDAKKYYPDLFAQYEARREELDAGIKYQCHDLDHILDDMPDVDWLVKDEIPDKEITVLSGEAGIGKSYIALKYALDLAPDKKVVYVAAEGIQSMKTRVRAYAKQHGLSRNQLRKLQLKFSYQEIPNFFDPVETQIFIDSIRAENPDLVIIDTLAQCKLGADENRATDMEIVFSNLQEMVKQLDCAALVVHHLGKGGNIRGSSVILSHPASIIELRKVDSDTIEKLCRKAKYCPEWQPKQYGFIRHELGEFGSDQTPVPIAEIAAPEGNPYSLKDSDLKVLQLINEWTGQGGINRQKIMSLLNIGRGKADNSLKKLRSSELIATLKNTYCLHITDRGKTQLNNLLSPANS